MSAHPVNPACRYWLARMEDGDVVRLLDGCHGDPEGVAKAAKLHSRIFGQDGPWVMVELSEVPDLDPSINEDAARTCRQLVNGELAELKGGSGGE